MHQIPGEGLDSSPTGAHNVDRLIRYPQKVNIFRSIRANLKLSHQDVANETGLTRLYVIRAEQGVYPLPAQRLITWALKAVSSPNSVTSNESWIVDEYRNYQRRCRQENGPIKFHPLLTENPDLFRMLLRKSAPILQSREHPFRLWLRDGRYSLSVMQACKAFCISPTLLQRFVAEPWRVHTVPAPVRDALSEAGYQADLLDLLEEAYTLYRIRLYRPKEDGNVERRDA
jgi:transcriptional regulator with XRE-family HTH domain